jgi:hypothetical protein
MARNNIEGRLAVLEAEVLRLRGEVERLNRPRDWRSVIGMFTGDEFMKEVDEAGRRIRERDRQEGRKQKTARRRKVVR